MGREKKEGDGMKPKPGGLIDNLINPKDGIMIARCNSCIGLIEIDLGFFGCMIKDKILLASYPPIACASFVRRGKEDAESMLAAAEKVGTKEV